MCWLQKRIRESNLNEIYIFFRPFCRRIVFATEFLRILIKKYLLSFKEELRYIRQLTFKRLNKIWYQVFVVIQFNIQDTRIQGYRLFPYFWGHFWPLLNPATYFWPVITVWKGVVRDQKIILDVFDEQPFSQTNLKRKFILDEKFKGFDIEIVMALLSLISFAI